MPISRRASLERAIGAALMVVSAAGLVSGGVLLGQRADIALPVAIGLPLIGGAGPSPTPVLASPSATASPSRPVGPTAVLVGAGDIADCRTTHDEATARLLATIPGIVFTAGDNAYNSGTAAEFKKCYAPSWGRFRNRTRPALGNHDWLTNAGGPYFAYFGSVAGDPANGWYSYAAGTWHVIVLNSNCDFVGCDEGSPQLAWLKADLAAHPAECTLAIWHHPRFSSGVAHGNDVMTGGFWQVLYDAGADLIINGHDHDYERFAPQAPNGTADPVGGIREFVVGTGGRGLRRFGAPRPNSEVRNAAAYGVLKLKLAPGGYAWQFISVFGSSFGDDGSATCH